MVNGLAYSPQFSAMRILGVLLGHDMDGQIDEVLRLAEQYDKNENSFDNRCMAYGRCELPSLPCCLVSACFSLGPLIGAREETTQRLVSTLW